MILIFRKYIVKPISFFLLIYMANLSIDSADMEGNFDPGVNEIESLLELVIEVIMEQGNLLAEQDEPDPEQETCPISLINAILTSNELIFDFVNYRIKLKFGYVSVNYKSPFPASITPPPKS